MHMDGQRTAQTEKKNRGRAVGLIAEALDFLYPPRCPVCDRILDWGEKQIHPDCTRRLRPVGETVCLHCGRPVSSERQEYCYDCERKERDSFIQGKALYVYTGEITKSMYRFKYANRREYASFYGQKAVEQYGGWIRENKIDAIVPVPMYRGKQRKRGYNQAEVFAKAIAKEMGIPMVADALVRVKNTRPMKELNDIERKKNLKNAFQFTKFIVQYKCILLVDDIYTTGMTADTAAYILQKAGADKVYFLSICIGEGF